MLFSRYEHDYKQIHICLNMRVFCKSRPKRKSLIICHNAEAIEKERECKSNMVSSYDAICWKNNLNRITYSRWMYLFVMIFKRCYSFEKERENELRVGVYNLKRRFTVVFILHLNTSWDYPWFNPLLKQSVHKFNTDINLQLYDKPPIALMLLTPIDPKLSSLYLIQTLIDLKHIRSGAMISNSLQMSMLSWIQCPDPLEHCWNLFVNNFVYWCLLCRWYCLTLFY